MQMGQTGDRTADLQLTPSDLDVNDQQHFYLSSDRPPPILTVTSLQRENNQGPGPHSNPPTAFGLTCQLSLRTLPRASERRHAATPPHPEDAVESHCQQSAPG
ncbi:unnamed protein product [Pleuronectes platessa]|uniref:Uncharacterized protein n=1 Tax=Pleuronectes platessa TaxID=8262 RepID=A0A9N7TJN7_PLEPL|nr:unnamed protein product [Pleuronectes platessa]